MAPDLLCAGCTQCALLCLPIQLWHSRHFPSSQSLLPVDTTTWFVRDTLNCINWTEHSLGSSGVLFSQIYLVLIVFIIVLVSIYMYKGSGTFLLSFVVSRKMCRGVVVDSTTCWSWLVFMRLDCMTISVCSVVMNACPVVIRLLECVSWDIESIEAQAASDLWWWLAKDDDDKFLLLESTCGGQSWRALLSPHLDCSISYCALPTLFCTDL